MSVNHESNYLTPHKLSEEAKGYYIPNPKGYSQIIEN